MPLNKAARIDYWGGVSGGILERSLRLTETAGYSVCQTERKKHLGNSSDSKVDDLGKQRLALATWKFEYIH
jgi:hypothetical protein